MLKLFSRRRKMCRGQVCIKRGVIRPFLDERKIGRVGGVLMKLICDASRFGTRHFSKIDQDLACFFNALGFCCQVCDYSYIWH